jgi:type II secretory pathway pseudopilin PulG
MPSRHSEKGVTLIETMIAILVLTVGAVGMAATFLHGMQAATSSPNELIATQKAAEAIESVFSARDSHTITWAELLNEDDGGIFLDDATPMYVAGTDGILNTDDDGGAEEEIESWEMPGPDGSFTEAADNTIARLTGFSRQIVITNVSGEADDLREIKVIITYQAGSVQRTYELTALISAFA